LRIKFISPKNYPGTSIKIVVIKKINNRMDDHTIPALLRAEEVRIASSLKLDDLTKDPSLSSLYGSAVYSMFEAVISGRDIQRQNPLIDLCSLTSLRYRAFVIPIAVTPTLDYLEIESTDPHSWIMRDRLSEIYNSESGRVRVTEQFMPQSNKGLVILSGANDGTIGSASKEVATSIERLLKGTTDLESLTPTQSEVALELL
jgi:hypothetical protein